MSFSMRRSPRECVAQRASCHGSLGQAAVSAGAEGAADGSWEEQSGSEYQVDAESGDGSSSSSMSDDWEAEGSEADEAYLPEAESGGVQRRGTRGLGRPVGRGNPVAPSAAAAAAAAAGEQGAGSNQPGSLRAPYSNLLWCESVVNGKTRFQVSSQLCTDIAEPNSRGPCTPVQLTVVIQSASWDVQQHICRQLQLGMPAGQQQGHISGTADSSHIKQFGPYAATLKPIGTHLHITQLQHEHEPQTYIQYLAGKPHILLLQERVPGSSPPHFRMHIKPGAPSQSKNNYYALVISRAGEAPGLQVVPGSVTEVTNVGITRRRGQDTGVLIPKALACSQLPADTTFPLPVTLTVVGEGQWEVNLSQWLNSGKVRVKCCCSQALSTFAGRSISRMSLSQGRQLVITLAQAAPAPAPAPAAAQRTSSRVQQASHHTMAAAGRDSATTAAPDAPSNLAVPSTPTAAQALAAGSQPQSVVPLKRRAGSTIEPVTGEQQLRTGVAADTAVTVMTAAVAAAAVASLQPTAARQKKVKQAAQQTPPPAAAAARAAGAVVAAAAHGLPVLEPAAATAQPAADTVPATPSHAFIKHEAPAGLPAQPEAAGSSRLRHAGQQGAAVAAGAGRAPAPAPAPAAAAAAAAAAGPPPPTVTPVPIKVEAPEVMDLTVGDGDDDDAPAAAQAAAAATGSRSAKLPAGLRIAGALSLTAMEDELLKLMTDGLMQLLPTQQYACMMRQLQQLFDIDGDATPSVNVAVLQRKYKFVQAAVMGGCVGTVVEALQALIRACRG